VRLLLVSTYELGHQPLGLAWPAGLCLGSGHEVACLDLSVQPFDHGLADWADVAAFSVPMHTAARLALAAARRLRRRRPDVPVAFYGLYARPAALAFGPQTPAFEAEQEAGLASWAAGHPAQLAASALPARHLLPPLDRYARLLAGGGQRLAASVQASRGCSHRCRHCPVPVSYDGRTRKVALEAVLADVAQVVAMGAGHVSFADPDFLNRPWHSLEVVEEMHSAFPELSFDFTAKVSHLVRHQGLLARLASCGALFAVTAVESLNDSVLARLDKGHTAAEAAEAVELLRRHGIEPRPSFVPFTPWTRPGDVLDVFDFVAAHRLVGNVDLVQYSIRLLVPPGSLLLGRPDWEPEGYDDQALTYHWRARDPSLDRLQAELARLAEEAAAGEAELAEVFSRGRQLAAAAAGQDRPPLRLSRRQRAALARSPRLSEPWFCCAEPTSAQMGATCG
jgi:hypothetical protein